MIFFPSKARTALISQTQSTQTEPAVQTGPTELPPPVGWTVPTDEMLIDMRLVAEEQTVSGVTMTISNFHQVPGHLFVRVCFEQLGTDGWNMGPSTLRFANGDLSAFAGYTSIDERGTEDGTPGRYCNMLDFGNLPSCKNLELWAHVMRATPLEC